MLPASRNPLATDDLGKLNQHSSGLQYTQQLSSRADESSELNNDSIPGPYEPGTNKSTPPPRIGTLAKTLLRFHNRASDHTSSSSLRQRLVNGRQNLQNGSGLEDQSSMVQMHGRKEHREGGAETEMSAPRPGLVPRPIGGQKKLGTFSGVFVPTTLNILSILLFLRFGFVLGQGGVLGMMSMLVASYLINLVTTFSLSAIATNGTVRGGGAYYLISRSLGPEFGGSIGVVFYLGLVFSTALNAVGLVDCLKQNFGTISGNWYTILPEEDWWPYLWSTIVLVVCTAICLGGSAIFARASIGLMVVIIAAICSIPFSALVLPPFESRKLGVEYTGLSIATFRGNLMPQFTRDAAGSHLPGKENFQDLFGILFPATSGIFAGASMSGNLKHPSKAIPKGTLYGLALTFILYAVVILAMAATITRASFYRHINVVQDTNISGPLILAGEFATTFFSTLMGVIGSAKLLQALARDKLLPGLDVFGQGRTKDDEAIYAIIFTYVAAQIVILADINLIASFVTMTYLMTFLVMNLATFALKIGSAPNFRPSFQFFNWQTALAGSIVSGAAMFFVDGVYATGCLAILIIIFLLIHYTTPPRSWGDVSQSLIYHQVRKYLLRLRQEHVKFWRPQILLFVNDPRRQYRLIQFCNSMKKGALYILGHVIISEDYGSSVPEARRQQANWSRLVEVSRIKAFFNVAISQSFEWGARNIVLSAGLGGMRPNIAIIGFYNMDDLRRDQPLVDIDIAVPQPAMQSIRTQQNEDQLPTDTCKTEGMMDVVSYVTVLEDLLLRLQINVAVARGFDDLVFPNHKDTTGNTKKYIDLWPIQMSAEIASESIHRANVLTTNFDTYTLILQLGCILNTVPAWKKAYNLRVAVFVEYESDVEEERGRVKELLQKLRIKAEVVVFWLASGDLPTYEVVVNGRSPGLDAEKEVDECLQNQDWWEEIQKIRGKREGSSAIDDLAAVTEIQNAGSMWPEATFQQGPRDERIERFLGLQKLLEKPKRRHTMSGITRLGVSLGIRTHRLPQEVVSHHPANTSASEDSGSSDDESIRIGVSESDYDDEEITERQSATSEGDINEHESEGSRGPHTPSKMTGKSNHEGSMGGSLSSKKPTEQKKIKVKELLRESANALSSAKISASDDTNTTENPGLSVHPQRSESIASPIASTSSTATETMFSSEPEAKMNTQSLSVHDLARQNLEERFSALKNRPRPSTPSHRPAISRHSSMPKFSSKTLPITKVANEDGPGPAIMFSDTPSPPRRSSRIPSAYRQRNGPSIFRDPISEVSEEDQHSSDPLIPSRGGSTYSTQAIPLSFNDLPCRAQHLIINELVRRNSSDTAVVFTTLPSPVSGTSKSQEASIGYLSDLEVLCKGCPPCLLVHSNSMTVTTSL